MRSARRKGLIRVIAITLWVTCICSAFVAQAQHEGVSGTLHNLSVSGPGQIRSLNETEVCKFCHVPHSPVVNEPLWGQALSQAQYRVPDIKVRGNRQAAPQPDGASRLCLSCHDGTVALGSVHRSKRKIAMAGGNRLSPGRRGYLGTDLSGSHPVSIVVPDSVDPDASADMTLKPRGVIEAERKVRLDKARKMQCTTCHDPHSDANFREGAVPHFWVKSTVTEVCLACHELR